MLHTGWRLSAGGGRCNAFSIQLHQTGIPASPVHLTQLLERVTAAAAVTGPSHPLPLFLQGLLYKFLNKSKLALPRMEVWLTL